MKQYSVPDPIIDDREEEALVSLQGRYDKLAQPGAISKLGKAIGEILPTGVKDAAGKAAGKMADGITASELYAKMMASVAQGYAVMEGQISKYTLDEHQIVAAIDKTVSDNSIENLHEVCLARSYELEKAVASLKLQSQALAFAEGGATGAAGFIVGVSSNLVMSSLLFFRAVQSIAMAYGYDVKNDPAEMAIAGGVFSNSMNPSSAQGADGLAGSIGKIMMMAELAGAKQAAKRGWAAMIQHGGVPLVIAQMRALANQAAKKALEKAGKKGLEQSVFSGVLRQIGRKLALKSVNKVVPVVGGVIGAGFDTAQMTRILEYADVFYQKRFLLEKEDRIASLLGRNAPKADGDVEIIDVREEPIDSSED